MNTSPPHKDVHELGLEHAWKWFEYHASQRMLMIRFYLIAAGGIGAGIGALLSSHENLLAAILSVLGAITSFSFKRLDSRVSHLVKFGENALRPEQLKLATALGNPDLEICQIAEAKPAGVRWLYSYGQNFRFLFNSLVVFFSVTALIGLVRAVAPYAEYLCRLAGHGISSG